MSNLGKKTKEARGFGKSTWSTCQKAAKKSLPQTFQRPKSGKHIAFIFKEQQLV